MLQLIGKRERELGVSDAQLVCLSSGEQKVMHFSPLHHTFASSKWLIPLVGFEFDIS